MAYTALPSYLRRMISAADYGAVGDGVADDTVALQAALDAAFTGANQGIFLSIAPGQYKVTSTLTITFNNTVLADHAGILAHGAKLVSAITGGAPVFKISATNSSYIRFFLLEGLQIAGSGSDGHGLLIEVNPNNSGFYDSCIRDIQVEYVGGDGCRLIGSVFESNIFNSYFRNNGANGITMGHAPSPSDGILSAMHVFGCVFGQNALKGAELVNNAYDVAFHGCYFLENGEEGFHATNGFRLLSNCGFENNWESAGSWSQSNYAVWAQNFGTMISCSGATGSGHKQGALVSMYVVSLLMIASSNAEGIGVTPDLCSLNGPGGAKATIISSNGARTFGGSFSSQTTVIGSLP